MSVFIGRLSLIGNSVNGRRSLAATAHCLTLERGGELVHTMAHWRVV